jgi:putative dimethyl sulfoxide reductase chaperone
MLAKMKNTVSEEQIQTALSRAGFYRLFSRLFRREIDEILLEQLRRPIVHETLENIGLQLPSVKDTHKFLALMAEEYTRLFIGPGKHLPPYASVHNKLDQGLLNGRETAAIRRFMKATGLKFNDTFSDFPDHISAELEYMETLVQYELDALKSDNIIEAEHSKIIQKQLFDDFIMTWIPRYCVQVKDKSEQIFYRQLADCTASFLAMEKHYFSLLCTKWQMGS